jgi:hypothetical protein
MMTHHWKTATRLIAGFGVIVTIALALWAAQPWGGNYAYRELSGYLMFTGFTAWAISPQLFLFVMAGWRASRLISLLRAVTTACVCLGGSALAVNAVVIHPDPQSSLVFLFLPICQWAIIVTVELVLLCVPRRLGRATD